MLYLLWNNWNNNAKRTLEVLRMLCDKLKREYFAETWPNKYYYQENFIEIQSLPVFRGDSEADISLGLFYVPYFDTKSVHIYSVAVGLYTKSKRKMLHWYLLYIHV